MSNEYFLDTNVVVYAVSGDETKSNRSEGLLVGGAAISVQVLNEAALTLRRRFAAPWPKIAEISARVRNVCDVHPLTEAIHVRGLVIAARHRLHVYDSMIAAAALTAGCRTLYSEDMHDGLVIDGLTVRNPYV